jgi:demethylspheroidene O-methyltransferase
MTGRAGMAAGQGPLARLAGRLRAWADGLAASERFQRRALGNPLTRPLARREARRLHDLMAGFVHSQVLLACVELGLFERLRAGPARAGALALEAGLDPDRVTRLLQAAAALDLLAREGDGSYRLGPLGAAVLGAPGLAEMIRHHRLFYRDMADPVALLKGETEPELARFWAYVRQDSAEAIPGETATAYSRVMETSQAMVADETLAVAPLDGVRHLMDLGGGTGAFLEALAARHPDLRLTLVDLPAVAAVADSRLAGSGPGGRIRVVPGNLLEGPLPEGPDAASLVRVLYDHDDDAAARILARVHAALPPGGRVIVSEPMSGGARPSRSGDAYFGFYTLAMTSGRPRAPEAHARALEAAGFADVRVHAARHGLITRVVSARRP